MANEPNEPTNPTYKPTRNEMNLYSKISRVHLYQNYTAMNQIYCFSLAMLIFLHIQNTIPWFSY